jgi:hypothetical protein
MLLCEGRKELVHKKARPQMILFSKVTGAFLFRIFGGFLRVPTTKAVNREDKRSRRYRDREFAKFERSRRYRDR